jgi:hypothetical protein
VPVHTLARNMGTLMAMIERHYGHLTPRLAATDLERWATETSAA